MPQASRVGVKSRRTPRIGFGGVGKASDDCVSQFSLRYPDPVLYWRSFLPELAKRGVAMPRSRHNRWRPGARAAKMTRARRAWIGGGRRLGFERLEPRQMLAAFDVLVFSKTAGFRHDSIDE